jgi:hypothetical protein
MDPNLWSKILPPYSKRKMEAEYFSETFVPAYQISVRKIKKSKYTLVTGCGGP